MDFLIRKNFFANVLRQLSVDFIRQFKIDKYRYDFKFVYKSKKYLIETDGGLGHGHRLICKNKDNDEIKNKLAVASGFILIRIDCDYGDDRLNYIKESIIKTVGDLFDLTNIDWNLCHKKAVKSLYYEVIECYKNDTKYAKEIAKKLGISFGTVIKYLRSAMDVGLLEKEIIYKQRYDGLEDPSQYRTFYHNKKVYCYEDAKIFNSINEAAKYYHILPSAITQSYKNGYSANKKHFVLYKDLPSDFDFKSIQIDKHNDFARTPIFYQYDLDDNLIEKYYGCYDLKTRSSIKNISNIYRTKNTKSKIAYGFKWKIEDA